jgi:hypothetical protein
MSIDNTGFVDAGGEFWTLKYRYIPNPILATRINVIRKL